MIWEEIMKCLIIDEVAPLIAQELSTWMQVDTLIRPTKSELIDVIGDFDETKTLSDIVHVFDVSGRNCKVYNDIANEHLVITC